MTNNNVLAGYRCPKCKSEGPFNIYGEAYFRDVTDDGVTEFSDFEWSDESPMNCVRCGFSGKAREFQVK